MLLSFSVSLWFFNRGNVFAAMPLAYPGSSWLLAALPLDRPAATARRAAATGLAGLGARRGDGVPRRFRVGLNVRASNVIDVGYSGVIGADRIRTARARTATSRSRRTAAELRPRRRRRRGARPDPDERPLRDARTAAATPTAPSPTSRTCPATCFGWSGKWDTLPAAHATSILWDLLALLGLALVGRRFGGPRLGATLAFAWVAWPFTQYASSSNTNDSIEPALLVWGFCFASSPALRGGFVALGAWTKFAPLLVVPLWSRLPGGARARAAALASSSASWSRRLLAFFVLLPRAVAAARGARLLRPHVRLPVRPRLAVLALGLAAVPREGHARPAPRPARAPGLLVVGSLALGVVGRGAARRSSSRRSPARCWSASSSC